MIIVWILFELSERQNLHLLRLVENKLRTRLLPPVVSWALLSSFCQLLFILLMFTSDSQHNLFLSPPLFFLFWGFSVWTCVVIQLDNFHNVYPIHVLDLYLISFSATRGFILPHNGYCLWCLFNGSGVSCINNYL